MKNLWTSMRKWSELTTEWTSAQFESINAEEISAQVTSFVKHTPIYLLT